MDFVDNVKVDLFPDEVYVFTPRGEIRQLQRGATPVDFAYAVHSELGDRCVAARLDGQLEPLNTHLRNGQTVEIITSRHARPNAAWLNFVKTAKARSAIRGYLRTPREDEARSEEHRVGKEGVSTCRARWSPYHEKKKKKQT